MYQRFGDELERCLAGEVLLNPASLCNDDLVDDVMPAFGLSASDLMRDVVVRLELLFGPDLLVKRARRELELVVAESLEKGEPLPELVVFSDAERLDFADFVADLGVLVEVIRPGFERTGVSYERVRGRLHNEANHYGLEWHSRYNVDDWLRSALPFDPAVYGVGECFERAV
ncbi:MAG: hypothetical protein CMI05_08860 [Oceanospirillaceae bacterium]|nr:hypothetical protein [Oceanospirillaceae bacterium]|tara:strand:- start:25911 stop:26426 length:516 start_codon:yes stop_codon:yes gene_type:complete